MELAALADVVGGDLADDADAARTVDEVTIDSRGARPGSLFVPLRGERADGHDFLDDAVGRGATGYLFEARRPPAAHPGAVVVDDPADALLGLGAWVRDTIDPTVVAITGSSGKTTTKDLVAAAVGAGRRTVANPGSYNNELGVPLTCCRLEADTEVLVAEVATRGVGHIARLATILAPDIAVVTTVGASHLATLGDLDTVARAKAELVQALGPDGLAVLNADDPRVAAMAGAVAGRVLTYGRGADADWRADDVTLDELARPAFSVRGRRVRLALPGEHNIGNALAALVVADAVGVDLGAAAAAVESATVSRWRSELLRTPDGLVILNDAYNANPSSTRAALATLASITTDGRRWAVLGHMAELGPGSDAAHEEIGRLAARLGVDGLVVVGEAAAAIRAGAAAEGAYGEDALLTAADPDGVVGLLEGRLRPGDVVLVKASRSVGLEGVADHLRAAGDGPPAGGHAS
ncbi:MAG TPA: UDP-N-acetylmuramoyl-tripeptide--D-alanyl-D-alanine ligase [Egibacteraceae bacterium]|nr:UDP-N-acetylmuramoyl-tripeptide--D-alanyl-D-alanine ligase [Egibacteraceae bacterium]